MNPKEKTTMHKVNIYTLPSCHHCHQAKEFLSRKGVEYVEFDISKDGDALHEKQDRPKAGRLSNGWSLSVGKQHFEALPAVSTAPHQSLCAVVYLSAEIGFRLPHGWPKNPNFTHPVLLI